MFYASVELSDMFYASVELSDMFYASVGLSDMFMPVLGCQTCFMPVLDRSVVFSIKKTLGSKPLPNLRGVWGGYYCILSCRVGIIIY